MTTKTAQRGVVDEIDLVGANCWSYSLPDRDGDGRAPAAERVFANALRQGAPLVLTNECSKVDAAKVAARISREKGTAFYRVIQHADPNDPKRSLVVAWRPDSLLVDRPVYQLLSRAGEGIDARYRLRVRVTVLRSARRRLDGTRGKPWRTSTSVSHRPPKRSPTVADVWLLAARALRGGRWQFADFNDLASVIAKWFARPTRFVPDDVVGFIGPPGAWGRMSEVTPLDLDGDHRGGRMTIRRYPRGTKARLADTRSGSA